MNATDLADLDRDALIALILKQARLIEDLRAEIGALKRSSQRQAAPPSKGARKETPEEPGRKPGQGLFRTREAPAPEAPSEPPIDVPAVEAECPKFGGEPDEGRVEEVSTADLPEVVRPRVRLFRARVRRCRRCRATVRGRHPDLAPDQRGATAHRLGPRLLAAAHFLHSGPGVPVRRLPDLFEALAGVRPSQGAITLDALKKAAAAIGTTYRDLCDSVREAPFAHTDDTGRHEGGSPRWLTVSETDEATVDHVRPRHRSQEVHERIPADHAGTMLVGCEAAALAGVEKQTRLAHVLRALAGVLKTKARGASRLAKRL